MFILIFAIIAMILWGVSDFFLQKSSRKFNNIEVLAFIGTIGAVVLLPFIWKDLVLLGSLQTILLLAVLAIISYVAAVYDCKALADGKLSVVDLIYQIELPITIILAFVFFGERLNMMQYFLLGFILLGLFLLTAKSFKSFSFKLEAGVLFAIISASLFGIVNFMTAYISRDISPLMSVFVPWLFFSFITLFLLLKKRKLNLFIKKMKNKKRLVLWTVLSNNLAWIAYSFAVKEGELSIVAAICTCYPVVAMLLGVFVNKEKITLHQYLGAIVAISATAILAFTI